MDSLNFIEATEEDPIDWSDAYERVENYLCSLRIQNKLILSQLVAKILTRASRRLESAPGASPSVIAMEEAVMEVHLWFASVLKAAGMDATSLGSRGRLALFLTDLPRRWQKEFLSPGPWHEEFLSAMRSSYLNTGPDFQKASMTPREIDLGPVSAIADETWKAIDRWPLLGTALLWTLYLGALFLVYILTR